MLFKFVSLAESCHASKAIRGLDLCLFHASQRIIFWVENLEKRKYPSYKKSVNYLKLDVNLLIKDQLGEYPREFSGKSVVSTGKKR